MAGEHVFKTSGSTCPTRQWVRSRQQMEQEALTVYGRLTGQISDILSFAPPIHSYGMLLGQVAADVTGARLQQCSLESFLLPELDEVGPCVILCIASTWTLLPSLLTRLRDKHPVVVLHSASIVPSIAAGIVGCFSSNKVRFFEIFGTTETGAIAHRPMFNEEKKQALWTVFDDVSLLNTIGEESLLTINSPRIAREMSHLIPSITHQSDDLIMASNDKQFFWLGRNSSLIKINGVRQNLDVIRAELSVLTKCQTLVCIPVSDDLRAEAYEILFSSTSLDEQDVYMAFGKLSSDYSRPLRIRRVKNVPVSVSGKPQIWAIQDTKEPSSMNYNDTMQSFKNYLNADSSDNDSASLPYFLKLSLRQRYKCLQERPQLAQIWAEEYAQWWRYADKKYRCITTAVADEVVPFRLGVKDTIDVRGMPTRLGLQSYRRYPQTSASALVGLDSQIKVQFKVATTELNIGFGAGCGNPLYPLIDPSGSSTGSAVSVAAYICDISLGTDVLGSVRWPASHCGMLGLRMTHKPNNLDGVFPLAPAMDALGWITRTADDLDFLLPLLGLEQIMGEQKPIKTSYHVGVLEHVYEPGITSSAMLEMLAQARIALGKLGMSEVFVRMQELWDSRGDAWQLCAHDAWLASNAWKMEFNTELHWSTLSALKVGSNVSEVEYERIGRKLIAIRKSVDSWFDEVGIDVVIFPIDPNRPFDLRIPQSDDSTIPSPTDLDYSQKIGFTPLASFSGLPAITLPITLSDDGKAPLALQLMGRRNSERQLIDIAKRLETLRGPLVQQSTN